MANESLEINSTSTNAGTQENKFIELSKAIYNRERHDKTMCVEVGEVNVMVSVKSILNSNSDREKLYKLIHSDYSILFDRKLIERIRCYSKQDFIDTCIYHVDSDNFSGLEYYVLRHLIDYHLDIFEEDFRSGKLNNIIKVCVSKDNLVVKVFPSKCVDGNSVSYTISLIYLVLMHLYKRMCYDIDVCEMIERLFIKVTPIVTKVVYTVKTTADDNYSWFTQLHQLKSGYKFFNIKKSNKQVRLLFRPQGHYLASTLNVPVINLTPSDTNYIVRFIKCTYTLGKDETLICKTTIVGKDMIDSVFSTWLDEENDPASVFSRLCDVEEIYLANYSILSRMLSFTKQHEVLKARANERATTLIGESTIKIISGTTGQKIRWTRNNLVTKHVFKDVKIPAQDVKLITIIKEELLKLGQKNNHIPYIIIVLELYQKDKSILDETLAPLDKRTSDKIKKCITQLKKRIKKLVSGYTLNKFYGEW